MKIRVRPDYARAVEETSHPQQLRSAREIARDALEHEDMRSVYANRIHVATAALLSKHDADTRIGPAIKKVSETLTTFLPVEKSGVDVTAWGDVPIHVPLILSRHTNLMGNGYKGGSRMAPDVNVTDVQTLSSDMTRKLALLGIPMWNGAKMGIVADSRRFTGELRKQLFTGIAHKFFEFIGPLAYVPAGDFGTDTPDMEILRDAYAGCLQSLAAGILEGAPKLIGPAEFTPDQARRYFETNVIGEKPSDTFLNRIMSNFDFAREIANPVVTAKPEDSGGNAIRRGATSRGARVVLEEEVVTRALQGEWSYSLPHRRIDKPLKKLFSNDGSLSQEGQTLMRRFKEDGLSSQEKQLARGVIQALCKGKNAVIMGYGKVGRPLHAEYCKLGIKVVSAADESGIVHDKGGLDPEALAKHVFMHGLLTGFEGDDKKYERVSPEKVLEIPCDILTPAALGGVITSHNAGEIKARIISEAANDPTTADADKRLAEKGIFVTPDVATNPGGGLGSYYEWAINLSPTLPDYNKLIEPLMRVYRQLHPTTGITSPRDISPEELVEVHEQAMRDTYRSVEKMAAEFNVPMRQASCMRTILNLAEHVAENPVQ